MTLEGTLDATVSDDDVRFTLTVSNAGSDPVDLQFSDACRADFAVLDDDRELWRFTDGRMFAQVIGEETLGPNEESTYEAAWEGADPGEYTVVGELRARNRTCEARTEFTV